MCAAGGNLGRLMKRIIRPAAKAAVKDGSKTITHEHLFEAVKEMRMEAEDKYNPLNLDIKLNDLEVVHIISRLNTINHFLETQTGNMYSFQARKSR